MEKASVQNEPKDKNHGGIFSITAQEYERTTFAVKMHGHSERTRYTNKENERNQ